MNKKIKRVFLSLPMSGRTDEEILEYIGKLAKVANAYFGDDIELVDGFDNADPDDTIRNSGAYYLGESVMKLASCDVMLAPDSYYNVRGCNAENFMANKYGIEVYHYDGRIVDIKPF